MTNHQDALYDAASELMSMLGNQRRIFILRLLIEREISVGELARTTGLSQSALSQHLAKMRKRGVVQTRRDAQSIYYSCSSVPIRTLLASIDTLILEGKISVSLGVRSRNEMVRD